MLSSLIIKLYISGYGTISLLCSTYSSVEQDHIQTVRKDDILRSV